MNHSKERNLEFHEVSSQSRAYSFEAYSPDACAVSYRAEMSMKQTVFPLGEEKISAEASFVVPRGGQQGDYGVRGPPRFWNNQTEVGFQQTQNQGLRQLFLVVS